MVLVDVLRQFLYSSITESGRLDRLPEPDCRTLSDWADYLEKYVGLIALPTTVPEQLVNYPLWIVNDPDSGPLLVKSSVSILGNTLDAVSLKTGKQWRVPKHYLQNISDFRVLFEPFEVHGPINTKSITDFVMKPARGLMHLTVLYQLLAAFAASLLFIANFTILAYIVPAQNIGGYFAIGWLFTGVAMTLFLSHWLAQRVKFWTQSILEERVEIVRLSLFWSIRPHYINTQGAQWVLDMSTMVARTGQASSEALIAALSSIPKIIIIILFFT